MSKKSKYTEPLAKPIDLFSLKWEADEADKEAHDKVGKAYEEDDLLIKAVNPGNRAGVFRSDVPQLGSARAIAVISVGLGSPSPEPAA